MEYSNEQLKEVQDKSLEMIVDIARFFDEHNINYMISFGTLLGAVRHSGFIPWDDDVDFDMHIDDMRKLAKICKKDSKFSEKYFLQNKWTDPNVPEQFWRIRMDGTTMMDEEGLKIKMHWGLPIDLFPIYNASSNRFLRKIMLFCNRKMRKHSMYSFLNNSSSEFKKSTNILQYKFFHYILLFLSNCSKNSKYIYYPVGNGNVENRFIKREVFFPNQKIGFEGYSFRCPNKPEDYLKTQYGDFMQLPPENERVGHRCYIVDMKQDYSEYVDYSR